MCTSPLESGLDFMNYLFILLPWVLAVAHRIFVAEYGLSSCGTQA